MYAVATAALEDRRHIWGGYGGTYQNPSSNLSGAVSIVDAYVARLRQLRQIANLADRLAAKGAPVAVPEPGRPRRSRSRAPTCAILAWNCSQRPRSWATTCS
jgi:hypothetical protein